MKSWRYRQQIIIKTNLYVRNGVPTTTTKNEQCENKSGTANLLVAIQLAVSFLEPEMKIWIGTSRISGTNLNTRNQWPLQHQSRGDQRDIISGTSNLRVAMHAHGYFHPAGRRTSSSCNEDVIIGNVQQTSSTTESLQQRENNEKLDNMQATASLLVGEGGN